MTTADERKRQDDERQRSLASDSTAGRVTQAAEGRPVVAACVSKRNLEEGRVQVRSDDLKDMVVLVVGCGTPGSIGSAIAQALADAGADLVLADLPTSKLVAVGQKLVEQGHRVLTQRWILCVAGIPEDRRARHARRDLLKQFQKFPAD